MQMMLSLNSNIDVDGKRYHVQTEKLGWQIVTLVFEGGAVIARHKKDLSEVGAISMSPAEFATFMKQQHQSVIDGIRSHAKANEGGSAPSQNGQSVNSLEDVIYGPSVLPESPVKNNDKTEATSSSDDLITKFLDEWADEEEPNK